MAEGKRLVTEPLISLITINYKQAAVTCDFLESTKTLTYPRFEIIVVDNGSEDDVAERIQDGKYPNVSVVKSPQNLGFSGGNNLGIQHAKGDYLFLLNNDTIVTPNLLEQLLLPFSEHSEVGVVCPKIRYYDNPTVIQYAGYRPLNPYTGQTWAYGLKEKDEGQYDQPGPTWFAHGAALMLDRAVLKRAGSLDDSFFLYYEELDWSMRIRQAGFQIYYQPAALIFHRESMSVGKMNPMKVYYHTRNRLWFMRRNVSGFPLLIFCLHFFCLALPKALFKYMLPWQPAYLKALKDALIWNLTHTTKPLATAPMPVAMAGH
ncbi:glycosyltransferase family 2 protein [Spirosoma harenae]